MKTLSVMAFCLFILLVPGSLIKAQDTIAAFDTIQLEHTNYYREEYSLSDTLINTIKIQTSPATQVNDVHYTLGGDVLRGIMALTIGISLGGIKNVDWYIASMIRTNNPKLDWILDVYCPGYIDQQKTRVKNGDGSYSVETNYANTFLWQKGAIGFIIEAGDTIGWHYIHREPRTDTALLKWSQPVYKGKQEHSAINYREFALLGKFNGNESCILFNSKDNRIYLFSGNDLSGIYQCQKPPPQITFNKKKRKVAQPYLLVNDKLTEWERMDILRLAMVGVRMKNAIENY
jgi:hypothetical protein